MILIIGVRFRKSSKVYYFDPTGYEIKRGDHVIVETARGIEYGMVVLGPKEVTDDKVVTPLKPLTRPATPEDEKTNEENEIKEKEAYKICLEKIEKHELKMKLIDSEYTFDRNKLLFYFTADGRIDFRELVKDLASVFRTRIELRQIGVRDETKLLGGIAICGRPLCCHTFLSEFAPVSIKMAKEQGLSLNPTQISGVCGRLMCCLKNEQEAYEELNRSLPSVGSQVKTIDGYVGEVQSTSVLKQLVKVYITKKGGDREIREYPVSDLSFKDHQITNEGSELEASLNEMVNAQELEQLEIMEKQDLEDRLEEENEKTSSKRDRNNNRRSRNQKRDRGQAADQNGNDRNFGHSRSKNDNNKRQGQSRKDREKRPPRSRGGYDNQALHLPETDRQEQSFRGNFEQKNDNRREKGRPERFREERSRRNDRESSRGKKMNNHRRSENNRGQAGNPGPNQTNNR